MDSYLFAARELVTEGASKSGTPLSEKLEFHLSATLARYMNEPLDCDRMTIRMFHAVDGGDPPPVIRRIGDDCLISCSLFAGRLRSRGANLRYYAGLGQMAYEHVGMTEEAYGFLHMVDVLSFACGENATKEAKLDLAIAGSTLARKELASENVIIFRPRRH